MNMTVEVLQWFIIPTAFVLDLLLGDPPHWPHPVRWMGRAIQFWEPLVRRYVKNEYLAGTVFALMLIIACSVLVKLITLGADRLHPLIGWGVEVILIFFTLSSRSLYEAAMEIYHCLTKGRVHVARSKVAMIVGRDVRNYGADDIARATVETVAENFVDGVLSPLFFAAIGGAPLAMAYKMVNTLDSMVGYKNKRYLRFGRAAARIDDAANYIPARLSVAIIALSIALLAPGRGRLSLKTAIEEGRHHSSPNAGYAEAAFAGALKVRLNGPNYYDGRLVQKPFIGKSFGTVQVHHVPKACNLMMLSALFAMVLAWGVL